MNFVIFGLSISSSWGNGHATLWRGLCRALTARSHHVTFFEQDVPYYRNARDLFELEGGNLVLYRTWDEVEAQARLALQHADAALVTSYCPDGPRAAELVLESTRGKRIFYDLDTPVTLAALESSEPPAYLPTGGLGDFDLVLSFTGGRALELLQEKLGARRVAPLYGHADPEQHHAVTPEAAFRGALSYLGTYSRDRQEQLEELFIAPARAAASERFLLAGSMYPDAIDWPANVVRFSHLPPTSHSSFFCSTRLTLNVTRATMARLGYCPSGRLFEAAACGAVIVSDWFEGLDQFFDPWHEVIVVRSRDDVLAALELSDVELRARAERTRERMLRCHTAQHRARELENLIWPSARSTAAANAGEPVREAEV